MQLWIHFALLLLLQTIIQVQPIRVDESSSKFLIDANSPDRKDPFANENHNDLAFQTFDSNRSHPRIKNGKKRNNSSPQSAQSINILGVEKTDVKKGSSKLVPSSFVINPSSSQYLGFTVGSHLLESSSLGKTSKKHQQQNQSPPKSIPNKQSQTTQFPKKFTNVKLPDYKNQTPFFLSKDFVPLSSGSSNVENTINRPKSVHQVEPEKPVQEYFSADLTELIEKAQRLDNKGSPRKHRNSEDDSLGYKSDKYEVHDYLDHKPYSEVDGEYHVYHGAPEKKKKKEIHYHQHKHLHEHDHDQKHSHKHQSGHHHEHGHDHHQKHSHSHGHDDDHWHDHHEKGEHHHKSHQSHDHHGSHDHKHHEDHDHKHDSGHHHDHEDHHDHHEDHKNWHSHKHHGEHDHRHGHDHKHRSKHGHDHHHGHKHKHGHHQKHGGKH